MTSVLLILTCVNDIITLQDMRPGPITQSFLTRLQFQGLRVRSEMVPYLRGDDREIISMAILNLMLNQAGLLSVKRESMCTKYWLTT